MPVKEREHAAAQFRSVLSERGKVQRHGISSGPDIPGLYLCILYFRKLGKQQFAVILRSNRSGRIDRLGQEKAVPFGNKVTVLVRQVVSQVKVQLVVEFREGIVYDVRSRYAGITRIVVRPYLSRQPLQLIERVPLQLLIQCPVRAFTFYVQFLFLHKLPA